MIKLLETLLNEIEMLRAEVKKSIEFYEDQIFENEDLVGEEYEDPEKFKQYIVHSAKRSLYELQGKDIAYKSMEKRYKELLLNEQIDKRAWKPLSEPSIKSTKEEEWNIK